MAKVDWGRHIEAWHASGLSQAAYCRRHGLSASYFSRRLRAHRAERRGDVPALIPVRVMEPEGVVGAVLLTRQGHRLEFPALVSAQWLGALLQCLG